MAAGIAMLATTTVWEGAPMRLCRRDLMGAAAGAIGAAVAGQAGAQTRPVVKIAVLTDLSGPYQDIAGQGSIACARQAVAEFAAASALPFDIEIVSADHRNDPARAISLAAHFYDHASVDLILDVPNSAVALAVAGVAQEKAKAYINCGAGANQLTGSACSPYTIQWSFDTNMLARSTGGAFTQAGGATWFFVTANYLFGQQMEQETTTYVIAAGGRIEGSASYPFPGTTDFTPFLRQAQQSGATVLGLANAGADVTASIRAARAIGLAGQMRIACLLMLLPDVHLLGLDSAGGLLLTESFYWDSNDRTRAFTRRLMAQQKPPFYPDMIHAGCYAGTLHFLKAVAAMGAVNAKSDLGSVIAHMKANPTDDDAFGKITIRRDGRAMVPALLFQVKTPSESSGPWDYYRLVSTTPAEQAFSTLSEGGCSIVKT
jgi:branched-chain amino acid transport system substrate-binding protein